MADIEKTQFSMVEFNAFRAAGKEPVTAREKYMATFGGFLDGTKPEALAKWGGLENIQRIRVIEVGVLGNPHTTRYDFVMKLPLHVVEQKQREAERKKVQDDVRLKLAQLAAGDPKAFKEFCERVAAKLLGKAMLQLALAQLNVTPTGKKLPQQRHRVEPKPAAKKTFVPPASKDEAFERALKQDRRNRIEAQKRAAEEFHKEHAKSA